jgi:hypothetical protein
MPRTALVTGANRGIGLEACRTEMGGPSARRAPEEAAAEVVWLATLPADGPTDGFFRYRRRIPW